MSEDLTPDGPGEGEGMYPCKRCGAPTWFDLCDACEEAKRARDE